MCRLCIVLTSTNKDDAMHFRLGHEVLNHSLYLHAILGRVQEMARTSTTIIVHIGDTTVILCVNMYNKEYYINDDVLVL